MWQIRTCFLQLKGNCFVKIECCNFNPVAFIGLYGEIHGFINRGRQYKTLVIIGMLPNEVDSSGRTIEAERALVLFAKGYLNVYPYQFFHNCMCNVKITRLWRFFRKKKDGFYFNYIAALGRVKVKVVPCPSLLRTIMVCSWASIICFTMARPSPVPPISRERPLSVR